MNEPDARESMADLLASHGRPVNPEGRARARARLADAAARRDPAARAAVKRRLATIVPPAAA